jgi:general L-amino acid transport system substrate-binding protein
MMIKHIKNIKYSLVALGTAASLLFTGIASAGTLEDVQAHGELRCGVHTGLLGFSHPDEKGEWQGLDVDVCRAVAAAVLGDAKLVKYIPTTAKSRFSTLNAGEVDLLARNTTWTLSRDVGIKLTFVGINFYDGQGFMVRKDLGVNSATELNGATVCIRPGTTTELNLADYFNTNKMSYKPVVFESSSEITQAYNTGRCKVMTTDRSGLLVVKSNMANPDEHMILPEVISKEPLSPAVRHGDDQWADIVRWSLNAMIAAEELGVHSGNVDEMKNSNNPEVLRLLGVEPGYGKILGLQNDWAYRIIKQVGNYGESYNKHVGPDSPFKLDRGYNAPSTKGGLLYSPPFR